MKSITLGCLRPPPPEMVSGRMENGEPFHRVHQLSVRMDRFGLWSGYFRNIWFRRLENEELAIRWLHIHPPECQPPDEVDDTFGIHMLSCFSDSQDEPERMDHDALAFCSGLSRSNQDIARCIAGREPVGVSVHSALSEPMRRMIVDYANDGGLVFIDSGSFTAFTRDRSIDWSVVAGRYKEIFYRVRPAFRTFLYLVAPDVIGDPDATAALQEELSREFSWIMEDGGNLIVPYQRTSRGIVPGDLDDAWPRAAFPHRYIIGIPYNKRAWSEDEVIAFMSACSGTENRIHLLGGGPSKVESLIRRARALGITCGSVTGDAFHGEARDRTFNSRPRKPNPGRSASHAFNQPLLFAV